MEFWRIFNCGYIKQMDIAIFSGTFCASLLVGLTLKKHGVFLVPQSLNLMVTTREYFDKQEREMQQLEVENYFTLQNTTRHLGSNQLGSNQLGSNQLGNNKK